MFSFQNWYKEFLKWLGSERIDPFVVSSKNRVDVWNKQHFYCFFVFFFVDVRLNDIFIFKTPKLFPLLFFIPTRTTIITQLKLTYGNLFFIFLQEFLLRPNNRVMIISYEMVVRCIENIRRVGFDLIVCDEAHRLKNNNVKITSLISGLEIPRCVLLTGTPIQNNLEELFTLADIACPSVLGK